MSKNPSKFPTLLLRWNQFIFHTKLHDPCHLFLLSQKKKLLPAGFLFLYLCQTSTTYLWAESPADAQTCGNSYVFVDYSARKHLVSRESSLVVAERWRCRSQFTVTDSIVCCTKHFVSYRTCTSNPDCIHCFYAWLHILYNFFYYYLFQMKK